MKTKQGVIDLLTDVKEKVECLEGVEQSEIDEILEAIDKVNDYFEDYSFEVNDKIDDIEIMLKEVKERTD